MGTANNTFSSDVQKRRFALLLHAGYLIPIPMKTSDTNYGNKKTGESIPSFNLAPFGRWDAAEAGPLT